MPQLLLKPALRPFCIYSAFDLPVFYVLTPEGAVLIKPKVKVLAIKVKDVITVVLSESTKLES